MTQSRADALILTKPLGVGVYSAALKRSGLAPDAYAEMLATTTCLNRVGAMLGPLPAVHAVTDVTGFGLLGHALEMARGAGRRIVLDADRLPLLARTAAFARAGSVTGASGRNWASYGHDVALPDSFPEWRRHILTDPQTSGGLLIACDPAAADDILRLAVEAGHGAAAVIGRVESGPAGIMVVAQGARAAP